MPLYTSPLTPFLHPAPSLPQNHARSRLKSALHPVNANPPPKLLSLPATLLLLRCTPHIILRVFSFASTGYQVLHHRQRSSVSRCFSYQLGGCVHVRQAILRCGLYYDFHALGLFRGRLDRCVATVSRHLRRWRGAVPGDRSLGGSGCAQGNARKRREVRLGRGSAGEEACDFFFSLQSSVRPPSVGCFVVCFFLASREPCCLYHAVSRTLLGRKIEDRESRWWIFFFRSHTSAAFIAGPRNHSVFLCSAFPASAPASDHRPLR